MSVYHVSSVERAKGGDVLVNLANESWPVFYDVCQVGAVSEVKGAPVGEVLIYVTDFELAVWGGTNLGCIGAKSTPRTWVHNWSVWISAGQIPGLFYCTLDFYILRRWRRKVLTSAERCSSLPCGRICSHTDSLRHLC